MNRTRRKNSLLALLPLLMLLLLVLGAAGCQRRTNIVLIPPDSTRTSTVDSSTMALRETQQAWEGGGDLSAASASTALLVQRELGARSADQWRDRASYLLDSLGVGAEYADAHGALAINFFARSDPEGGSWPYLFWTGPGGVGMQSVEGKGLHLQSIVTRGIGVPDSTRLVAASFTRRATGGLQPLVMTWAQSPKATRWNLVQTLGPDSLGTYGTAGFEHVSDAGAELSARTYRTPRGFVECATCPHAYTTTRFAWTPQGFQRTELHRVASPYATFADFIAALVSGDRVAASEKVADPALVFDAQRLGWTTLSGGWRPSPGADETPGTMTFFHGSKDAFAVHFRQQGDGWVITSFEPVSRSME